MKFLYQTFTDYNLEEFTRFNMIVPLRISRYRPKILAVCYILMIFSGFLRVFTAPGTSAFTYLLVVFAIPLTGVCFQAPVPQGLQCQSSAAGAPFCHAFL